MGIPAIVTRGYGSFGTIADIVRSGYSAAEPAVVTSTTPTDISQNFAQDYGYGALIAASRRRRMDDRLAKQIAREVMMRMNLVARLQARAKNDPQLRELAKGIVAQQRIEAQARELRARSMRDLGAYRRAA